MKHTTLGCSRVFTGEGARVKPIQCTSQSHERCVAPEQRESSDQGIAATYARERWRFLRSRPLSLMASLTRVVTRDGPYTVGDVSHADDEQPTVTRPAVGSGGFFGGGGGGGGWGEQRTAAANSREHPHPHPHHSYHLPSGGGLSGATGGMMLPSRAETRLPLPSIHRRQSRAEPAHRRLPATTSNTSHSSTVRDGCVRCVLPPPSPNDWVARGERADAGEGMRAGEGGGGARRGTAVVRVPHSVAAAGGAGRGSRHGTWAERVAGNGLDARVRYIGLVEPGYAWQDAALFPLAARVPLATASGCGAGATGGHHARLSVHLLHPWQRPAPSAPPLLLHMSDMTLARRSSAAVGLSTPGSSKSAWASW